MFVPLKSWMVIVCILIGALAVWYSAFESLPFPLSADDSLRVQLAQRWAQKVASNVTKLPGRPQVAVARVVNDENGILTAELKRWIGRRNVRMVNDQWYAGIGYWSGAYEEPVSLDGAVEPLVGQGVDYIIAAYVDSWVTYPEFEMRLVGFVQILDGATGRPVMRFELSMPELIDVAGVADSASSALSSGVATSSHQPSARGPAADFQTSRAGAGRSLNSESASETSQAEMIASQLFPESPLAEQEFFGAPWTGMSGWIVAVGSLPLLLSSGLRRLLRRRCNRTNAALLLTWLLTVTSIAIVLWGRFLPVSWGLPATLVATVLSVLYFAWFCRFLELSG